MNTQSPIGAVYTTTLPYHTPYVNDTKYKAMELALKYMAAKEWGGSTSVDQLIVIANKFEEYLK